MTQAPQDLSWTRPYFGVQHLSGLPDGYRISVNAYNSFSVVYIVDRDAPFTPIRRETCDTADEARQLGLSWAADLIDKPHLFRRPA